MGTLALYPKKLTEKPITLDGEWYYFESKTDEELARKLYSYRRDGYIEFEEVPLLIGYADGLNDPDDEQNFRPSPRGYLIRSVNIKKVTDDLTKYLSNWRNDKLLTSSAHKPDDYKYQHDKLHVALKRAYKSQSMPRINGVDVYGHPSNSFYDYQPPFWEAVLAPQLLDRQYTIRQLGYDLRNEGQPFVDVEITSPELRNSLEFLGDSSNKQKHKSRIFMDDNDRTVCVELDGTNCYRLSRRLRVDNSPYDFMNYVLSHPRSRIGRAKIEIETHSKDITELIRACGFDKYLKAIFFPGTTEREVFFEKSPLITSKQAEYIKNYNWEKVGKRKEN